MDLNHSCFCFDLDPRLVRLYAPDAGKDDWAELPRDAVAARALLGTVSSLTGHRTFPAIARSALDAHERYLGEAGMTYALYRDAALREAFPDGDVPANLDWAALILESIRIKLGDDAFGPFLRCVLEAEDAVAARHAALDLACA